MGPRTVGKIVVGVLTVLLALLTLIYAFSCSETAEIHKGVRAVALGLAALTCAISYRYFED